MTIRHGLEIWNPIGTATLRLEYKICQKLLIPTVRSRLSTPYETRQHSPWQLS